MSSRARLPLAERFGSFGSANSRNSGERAGSRLSNAGSGSICGAGKTAGSSFFTGELAASIVEGSKTTSLSPTFLEIFLTCFPFIKTAVFLKGLIMNGCVVRHKQIQT
jgi:hypothetical protein